MSTQLIYSTPKSSLSRVKMILLALFISIASAFFFNVLTSNPAYAGDGTGIGVGDDGSGDGGGDGGGTPTAPKPPTRTYSGTYKIPSNVKYFTIECQKWGGGTKWKTKANCTTTKDYVVKKNPTNPKTSSGYMPDAIDPHTGNFVQAGAYYLGGQAFGFSGNKGATCSANGEISAWGQSWSTRSEAIKQRIIVTTDDGRRWEETGRTLGTFVYYSFSDCKYPQPQRSDKVCYWNFGGNIKYSKNRTVNVGSWAHHSDRKKLASDPSKPRFSTATGPSGGKCSDGSGVKVNVETRGNVDKLGYYSPRVTYNWSRYTRTNYVGNGKTYLTKWANNGTNTGSKRNYFTYSCRPNQSNAIQGPYSNQASIPNVDKYLDPARCPQVSWQCVLDTPTTIGLNRTAVINGTVRPSTKATVMRNGEKVNIDFGRIRIIDTSTSRNVNVTNGGSAPSIRNVTNIAYQTKVVSGSTPFLGKDPNATQQYFKYYKTRTSESKEKFGSWINHNNNNLNKAISFNWASDSASAAFKVSRSYRVTAEFYVPGGSTVGNNGAGGKTSYQWKKDTYDCRDYKGRGNSRVDLGPLVSTSNPVEVVRSVNQ